MKSVVITCGLLLLGLIMLSTASPSKPAYAVQQPPGTALATLLPTPPPVAASNVPSAAEILKLAEQARSDAAAASEKANNVVNNANNAVNTVNLLLNFVQAASLFGGILASVFAILGTRIGSRTLNDYREELKKAQQELEQMHSGLNHETEQVRTQADRAIRALALMQLGEQQLEQRNIRGALQMYQRAAALDPDNGAVNYFLGELYIQDKQLAKGIDHLQRSLASDADYAPAEAALGLALRLQGDQASDPAERDILYAKAEERLLKALQIDSTALDIHGEPVQAAMGALYKRQGRLDQAIVHYEEARQLMPFKSYPVTNLAILHFRQGDSAKALTFFDQVSSMATRTLEANPQEYWARLDRMTAALALGKPDAAMTDLQVVLQQMTTAGPLESALGEITRMKNAPQPLQNADPIISALNDAIKLLKPGLTP